MENSNKGELNGFLTILLVLSVIGNIIRYITSISMMLESAHYDGYGLITWQTISSVLIIASVIGILMKKKWGVYTMFGWGAIVLLAEIIYPDFFSPNALIHDFLIYAFWGGLLFLRKDGKTAWNVLLGGKTSDGNLPISEENEIVSEKETIDNCEPTSCVDEEHQDESVTETSINNIFAKALAANEEENITIVSHDKLSKESTEEIEEYSSVSNDIDNNQIEANSNTLIEDIVDEQEEVKDVDNSNTGDYPVSPNGNTCSKKNKIIIGSVAVVLVLIFAGAVIWYNDYNSPDNRFQRANMYFSEGKTNKAIDMLTELAENDYPKAKLKLGLLYLFNDSIELDSILGLKYLKDIAVSDTTALSNLLCIYRGVPCKGKSLSKSDQAIYYANMAIKKGICLDEAYFTLGNAYCDNNDYESAFYYWTKATEYGSVGAYGNLGWMYYWGNGCKENNDKAYQYFMKAYTINPDNDFVLFYLGLMHVYGYGVKKDVMQGKAYLKRAAELGNEDARKEYSKLQMN